MSRQALLSFRQKLQGSRELRQQIKSGLAKGSLNLVELGRAHGCDFTMDEVKAYLQQEAELSDFELEMIAGGWGKGSSSPVTRPGSEIGGFGGGLTANTGAALSNVTP